jgi:hypothetical protein
MAPLLDFCNIPSSPSHYLNKTFPELKDTVSRVL